MALAKAVLLVCGKSFVQLEQCQAALASRVGLSIQAYGLGYILSQQRASGLAQMGSVACHNVTTLRRQTKMPLTQVIDDFLLHNCAQTVEIKLWIFCGM